MTNAQSSRSALESIADLTPLHVIDGHDPEKCDECLYNLLMISTAKEWLAKRPQPADLLTAWARDLQQRWTASQAQGQ